MKKLGIVLLTGTLLFVTVAPAAAHHGHVFIGPLWAPLLFPFAVAAAITTGVAAAITAPFMYPYAPQPPAPAYASPGYAAPGYASPSYASPGYAAPGYAAPGYAAPPAPPAPSYWYYCPSAGGYYPYVRTCPSAWMTVMPR